MEYHKAWIITNMAIYIMWPTGHNLWNLIYVSVTIKYIKKENYEKV